MERYLGEFEQLVLLALMRLDANAYGVTIRQEIASRTGRDVALGSVYKTLRRLEGKKYVGSRVGEPTPERGGRRKRYYRLEPPGARALWKTLDGLRRLTEGLGPSMEAS